MERIESFLERAQIQELLTSGVWTIVDHENDFEVLEPRASLKRIGSLGKKLVGAEQLALRRRMVHKTVYIGELWRDRTELILVLIEGPAAPRASVDGLASGLREVLHNFRGR